MIALVELGSGALAALIAILVTIVVLALIVARMTGRDPRVRLARVGVFVERTVASDEVEKPEDPDVEPLWRPVDDDVEIDTQQWPKREPDVP